MAFVIDKVSFYIFDISAHCYLAFRELSFQSISVLTPVTNSSPEKWGDALIQPFPLIVWQKILVLYCAVQV